MLCDIPYKNIVDNGRKYDVWVLRDVYDYSFADIAREYGVSVSTIICNYEKILFLKMKYYVNHLSIVYGYENTVHFTGIWRSALDCYFGRNYVVAYFEKEYADILSEYRNGEPECRNGFCGRYPQYERSLALGLFPVLSGLEKMKD